MYNRYVYSRKSWSMYAVTTQAWGIEERDVGDSFYNTLPWAKSTYTIFWQLDTGATKIRCNTKD